MATAIVGVVIASDSIQSFSSPAVNEEKAELSTNLSSPLATTAEAEEDTIAAAIVTRSDVDLTITNDEIYPWTIGDGCIVNGNRGLKGSTSSISFKYSSEYKTELSFEWLRNVYSWHTVLLYIDGVYIGSAESSDYRTVRRIIDKGEHLILLKDTITPNYSRYDYDYSLIRNFKIKEMSPLESTVLTEKSQPLTFSNDGEWPWTIEDGYIQNSNYWHNNTVSKFSTSFTITEPSKFSFWSSTYDYYDGNAHDYGGYQYFDFKINGERYMGRENGSGTTSLMLEPGEYTMEWRDSIYNNSRTLFSRVKDIELHSNWVDVELSTPGSLGVEILYKVNVLNDVELLKVKGTLNETDWTTIKNCKNLIGIDLTEAKFDAVPNNAFDGMSRVSSVKLPEGVKTIGEGAFLGTQLLNIDIPSSVTYIGHHAFQGTRVRTVNFKEDSQLETIGYRAFYQCSSLREFIMPNTVTRLIAWDYRIDNECSTFRECTSLKKIHFSDALTTLEQYVCCDCPKLTDIHFPKNLETVRYRAFLRNYSLTKVSFPESLKSTADDSFDETNIDTLRLPLHMTSVSGFGNCRNMKYVEFPSDAGPYIHFLNRTTSLETVVCRSATPPVVSRDIFEGGRPKSEMTLVVPSFAVVNYKLDTYWMQFGSIIEGDDIDYWKISGELSLTNNRRMNGVPDIDLYYGGKLRVGGNAPMETSSFNYFVNGSNPGRLINDCPNMTAETMNTYFNVAANTWYFFTPIHDVDLTKVTHSANASYVFRYYDSASRATNGTGSSWKNVENGKLTAGQGYIFQCNAAGTLTLPVEAEGHAQMFTTSDVTTKLTAYESTATANKSWNYVGNPYPAYYDVYYMDFTSPITVWTGSTYKAYSIVDDNFILSPMQSFFVQKPDEIDNIVFHKEGRQFSSSLERATTASARSNSSNSLRGVYDIQITSEQGVSDETRVVINDAASMSYEISCDASKFMSMENGVPQIFTLDKEGNSYAINERPAEDGNVALGYSAAQSGFYTISIVKAAGEILLYDKKMDKTIDLTTQDYTFYSDATEGVDNTRFKLIFGKMTPTGITSTDNACTSVVASSGCITINGAEGQNVMVFTADGRSVFSGTLMNEALRVDVANGAYIVKVGNSAVKTVVSSK